MSIVAGFLGVAHLHTPGFIKRLNDRAAEVHFKSVYDHDAARAAKTASQLTGAHVATDTDSILSDPDITAVVICSETVHHLRLVVDAARSGKHIFCEKPLGLGAADAAVMANAVKEAGVTFQTGFFMRSNPVHQFIKREVDAGNLGTLTRMRYTNCHQAALDGWFDTDWRWLADPSLAGGGAMLDLGAHPLDIILHTYCPLEGAIANVEANLGNRVGRYGPKVDEYGTALLTFESGITAVIEASWIDPQLRSPIEVFGTEGQIQVVDGIVRYFSKHVPGMDGKKEVGDLPDAAPHAFELFWDHLLGKPLDVPLVTVDEAAMGSSVMERIYTASGRRTS